MHAYSCYEAESLDIDDLDNKIIEKEEKFKRTNSKFGKPSNIVDKIFEG